MRKSRFWLLLIFSVFLLGALAGNASAQGSDPTDDDVNAIARQLYCPVCENIPLDACGTAACEQWRGIIRDKLAEGWSEDQIKDYFVLQYGDRVLAEPPRTGFNWLIYLVPLAAFAAGALLVVQAFSRWRKAALQSTPPGAAGKRKRQKTPAAEYTSRVEAELRKRREEG